MENSNLALIIEDEDDLAEIFSEALAAAGYETQTVNDGNQALAELEKITPGIIILDLHLPGVDGGKILNSIQADERLENTRVVVTSADAAFADALRDQVDMVLLKPITFSQLRDITSRLRGTTSTR